MTILYTRLCQLKSNLFLLLFFFFVIFCSVLSFLFQDYDRELHFSMVDGDFKKFEGKWSVRCGTR